MLGFCLFRSVRAWGAFLFGCIVMFFFLCFKVLSWNTFKAGKLRRRRDYGVQETHQVHGLVRPAVSVRLAGRPPPALRAVWFAVFHICGLEFTPPS